MHTGVVEWEQPLACQCGCNLKPDNRPWNLHHLPTLSSDGYSINDVLRCVISLDHWSQRGCAAGHGVDAQGSMQQYAKPCDQPKFILVLHEFPLHPSPKIRYHTICMFFLSLPPFSPFSLFMHGNRGRRRYSYLYGDQAPLVSSHTWPTYQLLNVLNE